MRVSSVKILLVDNYDSFTYNIAHIIRNTPGSNLQIIEAGSIQTENVDSADKILFSPGPDYPRPGNVMDQLLSIYENRKSILGICLGLQAIYVHYGGKLKRLEKVNHGRKILINRCDTASSLLNDLPETFEAGLYHSWVADSDYMPQSLEVTAISNDGLIMGIRHKIFAIEAVQFHPESIMTPLGIKMIQNWIRL